MTSFEHRVVAMSRPRLEEDIAITNRCFDLWREEFEKDLSSRGTVLQLGEFHRAAYISVLMEGLNIAGFSLHSLYDLREKSTLNHPYGQSIATFSERLDSLPNRSICSIEYLTVSPSYREFRPRLAEVLIRLAVVLAKGLGVGAVTGIARKDRRVDLTAEIVGFTSLGEVTKYNNACEAVLFDCRDNLKPNASSDEFISTLSTHQTLKKAA